MTEYTRGGARIQHQNTAPNDTDQRSPQYSDQLRKMLDRFREKLHLADEAPLVITLAATEANFIPGHRPCWLGVIGSPSSGKTEIVKSVVKRPGVVMRSTITEAGLLSGTSAKDRDARATGGLLMEMPSPGLLILKDLTSTISGSPENKAKVLAALREIYDGEWVRVLGTDGGLTLSWSGHLGLIAACTPTIDKEHATIGALGERLLFVRMRNIDTLRQAQAAADAHNASKHADDLASAVAAFLDALPRGPVSIEPDDRVFVARAANIGVQMRSVTDRDGRTREIAVAPEAEAPGRMTGALIALAAGLQRIGVQPQRRRHLLLRVVLDSMPVARRRIIEALLGTRSSLTAAGAEEASRISRTFARRILEDLEAFKIVKSAGSGEGKALQYTLTAWARRELEDLFALAGQPLPGWPA